MKDFIKYTLASMVGVMLVGVFTFVMSMVMITAVGLLSDDPGSIKSHSVLHLHLSGTLQDRADAENPLAELMGNDALASQGLDDYLIAIREAATNDDVDGIYIESGVLDSDYATLQALRRALVEFKKSKKFIIAYADSYTQAGYYVASVADKVYINPSGMLEWRGIASQPVFYTGLLEKLGVKMQVFKVGTYKSAVEPFILKGMSDANRAQVSSFISDIWQGVATAVSQSRRLPLDSLNAYADRYVTFSDAVDYKRLRLVDDLLYVDQVRDVLRKRVGGVAPKLVSPAQLALTAEPKHADDKVAVYYAEGAIVDAAGTGGLMGSSQEIVGSKVVSDLDALANDKKVKAVVLRINSGGGSAYASEQMWRAVQLLKKKKPVVVSMGGMAASGGYYMACGSNYIFAESATLTGSIGIFGMIPDASELLTQKLGLNFDVVKTNESADLYSQGRPFNAAEGAALQGYVNRGYKLFITRVANGRTAAGKKMNLDDVDRIGQGRVWTGNQALKNGLVDRLGSLEDAVKYAARLGKLKDYEATTYPAQPGWFEQFSKATEQDDYMERKMRTMLGQYYEPLSFMVNAKQHNTLQARMFFIPNLQ